MVIHGNVHQLFLLWMHISSMKVGVDKSSEVLNCSSMSVLMAQTILQRTCSSMKLFMHDTSDGEHVYQGAPWTVTVEHLVWFQHFSGVAAVQGCHDSRDPVLVNVLRLYRNREKVHVHRCVPNWSVQCTNTKFSTGTLTSTVSSLRCTSISDPTNLPAQL